jgi:site-specific recombinase XerD
VLYTLRHSWITDAITGGIDLLTVAKLAGTSLAMIEKHYGHLVEDRVPDQLAAIQMM